MTRIRSPRELRIVLAQAPAAGQHAGATAGARFGELFDGAQRAFNLPAAPDQRDGERGDQQDRDEPHCPADEDGAAGVPCAVAAPAAGTPMALARLAPPPRLQVPGGARQTARAVPARRGANASDAAEMARALGAQIVRNCARATAGELITDHLADRIARFCSSPALERAGGRWEVMIELDPAILPRTRLHLVLSDDSLSLRFDSRDARARQLICDNGDALRSRLEARLDARLVVHVEVN